MSLIPINGATWIRLKILNLFTLILDRIERVLLRRINSNFLEFGLGLILGQKQKPSLFRHCFFFAVLTTRLELSSSDRTSVPLNYPLGHSLGPLVFLLFSFGNELLFLLDVELVPSNRWFVLRLPLLFIGRSFVGLACVFFGRLWLPQVFHENFLFLIEVFQVLNPDFMLLVIKFVADLISQFHYPLARVFSLVGRNLGLFTMLKNFWNSVNDWNLCSSPEGVQALVDSTQTLSLL